MNSKDLRELAEAYKQVHAQDEEVETVDEKFSMAADPSKPESPRPTRKAENRKGMSLRSRAVKAVGTQTRQDKETGIREDKREEYVGESRRKIAQMYGQSDMNMDYDERNLRNRGDLSKRDAGSIARSRLKGQLSAVGRLRGTSPHVDGRRVNNEEVDIYDVILSHLLDEGYADSVESAEKIMVNMSEDWKEEILEGGYNDLFRGQKKKRGAKSERWGSDREGNPTGKYSKMQYQKREAQRERDADEQRRRDRGAMSRGTWDRG